LDPRTLLIYDDERLYINGAAHAWPRAGVATLKQLANARALGATDIARNAPTTLLHQWYRDGFLLLD
jgi:hypothetical protein